MSVSKNIIDLTENYINDNISFFTQAPINIETLITKEGINKIEHPFDDDIAGVLIIDDKNDKVTIGVNKKSSPERKNFTIAHELGHYILHNDKSNMFLDKVFYRKKSEGYTTKEEKIEKEANYFAANILMPENLVFQEIEKLDKDLYEDSSIKELARTFNVSSSAMSFRLINLGIL
ncbi:ImmA/IrrE family metallo-endopeptidase [Elizabethkingia meningoseptica]|uniref:ImmA/IrrE family metallo-endopeptidase n=1 Tax=Elizabethkingia TaxID=308865 RepID=UPI0022F1D8C8|nr:ImmA/IrrE family metallo-endopeptidase [Elizabethkingia meningoseptica]EJK5330260.1 ImmA/IrrE family metallo-endopeptidase [Elizabethkingia meningoseptica]WBS73150.1 ImmA/IrrE family metallo-endopeptidase [Elizabethkingia meningoseptica]